MSIFDDFVSNPDVEKVLLIEVKYYDIAGATERTAYLSTAPFITSPTDAPPNQIYQNRLTGMPYFTRRIPEAFYGKSVSGFGDIVIDNSEGDLDRWLLHGWDGRGITIKLGNALWPYTDFVTILTGTVEKLAIESDTELRLEIRDLSRLLDAPVQNNLLPSTSPAYKKPIPLCYGRCYNVKPPQLNSATLTYQVHDGIIDAITEVYDNGVALGLGVGYTANLTAGTFTLTAAPAGDITADVKGAKPSGSWLYRPGEIMAAIITRSGGMALSSSYIDSASVTTLDTARGYEIGIYIDDERRNGLDVLDEIVKSCGAYYGFNRVGLFEVGAFSLPSITPVISLDGTDITGDFSFSLHDIPIYKTTIGYERNWTTQSGGELAGAVSTARRGWLENEWRVVTAEDSSVLTAHLLAQSPEQFDTLISNSTDATTEAARILTLWKKQRFSGKIKTFSKPFSIGVGDTIRVTDDRFGLDSGVTRAVVTGLTEYFVDNMIELELFIE